MKKICAIFLGILIIGISSFLVKAESVKVQKFATYKDIVQQGKVAVIYVYNDACTYCRQLYPLYEELKDEFKNKYIFISIDVYDSNYHSIIKKLRVNSIPAIYIYNPKKNVFQKIPIIYYTKPLLHQILNTYTT